MFSDTECLERWNFTTIHKIILGLSCKDLELELESSTAEIDIADSNGRTAVSFAAERSDLKALSLLLRYGANPVIASPNQGSPLHFAATAVDPSSINILLEHGAEIDCVTSYSQTPLHYAAAYNNSEKHARALLAAGANPNFKDLDGMTPLHWTAVSGNDAVAKAILAHGGNVDDTDNLGDCALSQSIRANRYEIISLLLRHAPNLGGILANGQTILHTIAADADLETMHLLQGLDFSGIDASTVADDGQTALQVFRARENHQPELEAAFNLLLAGGLSLSMDEQPDPEEQWEDAVEIL
jgi:ankyrin repeat protein